jgi:hypothetical protein
MSHPRRVNTKKKMTDIFDTKIICKECSAEMVKGEAFKNGFRLRIVECKKCHDRIMHPHDLGEYNNFVQLKNKTFKVKLRLVGNSYAVSIPREIINFMQEQEKIMDDMVRLCFNDAKRLSLMFGK